MGGSGGYITWNPRCVAADQTEMSAELKFQPPRGTAALRAQERQHNAKGRPGATPDGVQMRCRTQPNSS